jgi:hypothetical protein
MQSSSDRPVPEDGEIIHHHQPMGGFGVGLHTIELTVRAQAIKRTPLYFIQDKVAGFSRVHSPMALSW